VVASRRVERGSQALRVDGTSYDFGGILGSGMMTVPSADAAAAPVAHSVNLQVGCACRTGGARSAAGAVSILSFCGLLGLPAARARRR